MQFKVPYEEIVRLTNEADVACQVVIEENSLCFVFVTFFVVDKVPLSEGVEVVQCVHFLRLSEAIVDVLLDIERVHKNEGRRISFIEQLLLEGVAVLTVVDDDLAVGSAYKPLVVWF